MSYQQDDNNNNSDSSTTSKLVEPAQVQEEKEEIEQQEEEQRHWYIYGKNKNKRLHLTEKEAEIINRYLIEEGNRREWGKEIDPTIPWDRATWSWEYRKCASPYCRCKYGGDFRHGPYLVMVWKDLGSSSKYPNNNKNKVKKKYLGKSKDGDMNIDKVLSDLSLKKMYKSHGLLGIDREFTITKLNKCKAVVKAAENGNKLAQEYRQKLDKRKVSIDWAYKKVFKLNNNQTETEKSL